MLCAFVDTALPTGFRIVKRPFAYTKPGVVAIMESTNWPTMEAESLMPKAVSEAVTPGEGAGRKDRWPLLRVNAWPFDVPTSVPARLIPLAFASGSLSMFSVVKVPFGLRTKFVRTVWLRLLLKPTIAPELL